MTTLDGMPATKGLVMHSAARYYDLLAWLLTLGRERAFRDRLVELARLQPGDAVLDVGCGTGTLVLAAKRRVGAAGTVHGIDASPEMIDRANRKAAKARLDVVFQTAVVEALPFPDERFDVVMSSLMLHHLPKAVHEQCALEMRRVLRPGGRVLAVDFETPARERRGLLAHLHRHGHLALHHIVELLSGAGFRVVESGSVGVSDLQFALATAPEPGDEVPQTSPVHVSGSLEPLPPPRWIWPVLGIILVAGHGIVLGVASSRLGLSAVAVAGIAGLLIIRHFRFVDAVRAIAGRRSRD